MTRFSCTVFSWVLLADRSAAKSFGPGSQERTVPVTLGPNALIATSSGCCTQVLCLQHTWHSSATVEQWQTRTLHAQQRQQPAAEQQHRCGNTYGCCRYIRAVQARRFRQATERRGCVRSAAFDALFVRHGLAPVTDDHSTQCRGLVQPRSVASQTAHHSNNMKR